MSKTASKADGEGVFRLHPYHYLHILDQNTNVTRVEVGPQTLIRQDHERVVLPPSFMVVIPPRHYVSIRNPVRLSGSGQPLLDKHGQAVLRFGEEEVRLCRPPFPLFPGEALASARPLRLELLMHNQAYKVRAMESLTVGSVRRSAGDEWLFVGPALYIPHPMVEKIGGLMRAHVVRKNQALRLVATQDCEDRSGKARVAGEEWLVRQAGAYLPGVHEQVLCTVDAEILSDTRAVQIRALQSFTDQFGSERKSGEEWLVTAAQTHAYIPSVHETVLRSVALTIVSSRQYAVVVDPYDFDLKANQLGAKKLVVGETSFFLQPGERLEAGVQDTYVLGDDEGVILSAVEEFEDSVEEKSVVRKPGDRWMTTGPMSYVPPVKAKVLRRSKAIALHKNEGVYVRDMKSGKVRAVVGKTYLLNENEELWKKQVTAAVELLLKAPTEFGRVPEAEMLRLAGIARDKTRVVSYRVPHNSAVQIYDFKEKESRIIFGPSLVILGPDEMFTKLSLSGGVPKRVDVIHTLHMILGPDFCTDVIPVETSDHAKLNLELSYNWQFVLAQSDEAMRDRALVSKLFNVPDFIGDLCSKVASRVRGAVAAVAFDDFHKNSARLIRASVFGMDSATGKVRDSFLLKSNMLLVTGIDIKSIEPDNVKTRELLQHSVQLAISITTQSQQALAQQEADKRAQVARGKLDRQKIADKAAAEKLRKVLSQLQADCKAVQTTGQARAEAQSQAAATKITAEAKVERAKLAAKAKRLTADSEIKLLEKRRTLQLSTLKQRTALQLDHKSRMATLDSTKFQQYIAAIGADTICSIARSGPELQRALVSALGVRDVLISDGKTPLRLYHGRGGSKETATPKPKPTTEQRRAKLSPDISICEFHSIERGSVVPT